MYRQLPCANRYLNEKWTQEENARIRRSHKQVKAAVDNAEPPRYRHLEYNAKRAMMAKEREREIDYDNRKLLETIRYQHSQKHPGALDDRMVEVGPKSLHSATREKELQRIVAENQRMYQMLSKPRPNIHVDELEREFQESEYHTGHLRVLKPEQKPRDPTATAASTRRSAGATGRTVRTAGASQSASAEKPATGETAKPTTANGAGTSRGKKAGKAGKTAKSSVRTGPSKSSNATGAESAAQPEKVEETGDAQIEHVYGEQPGLAEAEGVEAEKGVSPAGGKPEGEEGYLLSPTPEEGANGPNTPNRTQDGARGETFLTETVDVQF